MQRKSSPTRVLAVFAVAAVAFWMLPTVSPVYASGFGDTFSNIRSSISNFFYPIVRPWLQTAPVVQPSVNNILQNTSPYLPVSKAQLDPIVKEILANYPLPTSTTQTLIKRITEQPIYNSTTNTTNEVTQTIVDNMNFADVGINRLLFLDGSNSLRPLDYGTAGQVLQSNGDGHIPSWVSGSVGGVVDWANPGTLGSSVPNTAAFTTLSVAYSGDSGSTYGHGAFNLDNTNNIGNGFTLNTDAGSSATGDLMNISVTNRNFQNAVLHATYYGNRNAFEIVSNGVGTSSNALAVTGNNINDSTLGIIGYELGRGTIKVSHYRPTGLNDNNASAISIDLKGSGTAAQGLYIDSTETGGTTGNLIRLRNQSIDKFVVNYQGNVTQGGYGYDTTYTKYGNTTNDQFFVGTNGSFRVQRAATNSEAFRVQVAGDSQGRWRSTSDGRLSWGDGSNAQDVTMSRTSVGVLNLAGALTIAKDGAGNSAFQVNQTGAADILTASASGTTKFTIENSGNLVSANGSSWRPLSDTTSALKIANTANTPFVYFDTTNSRVGIGAAPTTAALEVSSGTALFGPASTDQFFIGTNGAFKVTRATSNSEAFRLQISGDTQGRILGTSDGRLKWGDGSNAQDVVLRRGSAGQLLLDGGIVMNNLNSNVDTVIKGESDSNLFRVVATGDKIGVGLSNPIGAFHISKNGAGNAALIVNQTGGNDILTASASGTTKFTVDSTGNLVSAAGVGWKPLSDSTSALSIQTSTASAFVNFDTTNGKVGIGIAVPTTKLQVAGGDILLDNNASYRMKDSGGTARPVLNYTSSNNLQLLNSAASGIVQVGINNASNTSNIRFTTGAGTEKMRIDNAGVGIGATTFGTSATNVLAIANGTVPGSSIVGGVQLYAESVASSSELRVRDEAGNITTLSPHNFSAIPDGKSDPMAWAFYSERNDVALNVDMLKTVRTVEALSGQQLAYLKDLKTGAFLPSGPSAEIVQLATVDSPTFASFSDLVKQTTNSLSAEVIHKDDLAPYATFSDQIWSFVSEVVFQMKATFQKQATFLSGAIFKGSVSVNSDTAGKLVIPVSATKVQVSFTNQFASIPVIYLSPVQTIAGGYTLQAVTEKGFILSLNQPQATEIQVNWLAVLQADGLQTHSQVIESGTVQPSASSTPVGSPMVSPTVSPSSVPSPSPSVIPAGEVSGTSTESAQATSSAQVSPTP